MDRTRLLEELRQKKRNTRFTRFCTIVKAFGFFIVRRKGSHIIFGHNSVVEILNLQPNRERKGKDYQIDQFIDLVEKYGLLEED